MISRKTQKYRGSRTHGRGTKAGRGKGNIGGAGRAGLSKHEKMRLSNKHTYFGRRGFKKPQCLDSRRVVSIALGEVLDLYESAIEDAQHYSVPPVLELKDVRRKIIYSGVEEEVLLDLQGGKEVEGSIIVHSASRKVREFFAGCKKMRLKLTVRDG